MFNVSVLEDVTYWLVRWSALRQLYYLVGDDESFGVVLVFTGFACVCGLSVRCTRTQSSSGVHTGFARV